MTAAPPASLGLLSLTLTIAGGGWLFILLYFAIFDILMLLAATAVLAGGLFLLRNQIRGGRR